MIHNISRFITALALLATAQGAWAQSTETLGQYTFTVGTDDEGSYYAVDCEEALIGLSIYINYDRASGKRFKQTADITMTGAKFNNSYFAPIGNGDNTYFSGTYDGGGHTISGLNVSHGTYAGLFGRVHGANLHDIVLVSPTVATSETKANTYVGPIVAFTKESSTQVSNCTVINPTFTLPDGFKGYAGAIVGRIYDGRATNCHFYGGNQSDAIGSNFGYSPVNVSRVYTLTATGCTATATATVTVGTTSYYNSGTAVSLGHADPAAGYIFGGYASDDVTITDGAFTMPAADVAIAATFTPDPAHFSQSGDTYTIKTTEGWNVFCDLLAESDKGIFTGKTVNLDADITVTRMAGGEYHDFTGTFDGGGHTLTFSHTATDNYCAPFRHVQGASAETPAVIHNLNVVSTVTADDYRHPAGLIALQSGHVSVTDCNVEAHISSTTGTANPTDLYPAALVSQSNNTGVLTVSGCTTSGQIATDGKYAAGLIGIVQNTASIENCRVSVTIQSTTSGDGTHGGLVASQASKTTITITGCLFDGSLLGSATNKCGGFIGWRNYTATITNSLFAPAEVTVQNDGSATFARNTVDTYNCYYTTLLCDGTNYVPTLADGTVSPAKWHNGKATRTVTAGTDVTIEPIALTGTATQYTVSGITAYSGGGLQRGATLYYGSDDQLSLTLSNSATGAPLGYQYAYTASAGTLSGSTLTMPDDDVTISVNTAALASTGQPVAVAYVDADGTLHDGDDAAQAVALDGTETSLDAYGQEKWYFVGIDFSHTGGITCYGDVHIILCDGKTMTVDGNGSGALWSPFGNFYFYGQNGQTGTLNATGRINAADNNAGTLTINGGIINATGDYGISAYGLIINGGTVNATGNDRHGIWSGGDLIINGGTVNATGKNFGIFADGTITLGWNKPTDRISITASSYYGTVQVADGQKLHNGSDFLGGSLGDPATALNGKTLRPAATATYTTADGTAATADAILLDASDNSLPAGNYLATGTLNYTSGITLTGNVTLILADNCHMNVGTNGEGRINGYGITLSGDVTLDITSEANGSGNGNGALNIYTKGMLNHGINVDALTINGGHVTADVNGDNAVALNAGHGAVTINGGTLSATATGSFADAIYAGGNFNYNGGNVTATNATQYAIDACGNYTFSWRTPADRITIGATGLYAPNAGSVAVANGQALTDGSGNIYTGTLTDEQKDALAGKTLRPCLALADAADNTAAITAHAGQPLAVALSGRTLYKDGSWNTLCLPFAVDLTASGPLSGDNVQAMTLNTTTSTFADGTLTLNFTAATTIPAGTPFIIKWDESGTDITNPVFEGVTIDATKRDATIAGVLTFTGTYVPVTTPAGDITKLYLGAANKLYYPTKAMTIGTHRAYFQLAEGITAGKPVSSSNAKQIRAFNLNFGDDEATGIISVHDSGFMINGSDTWYTLDGRRFDGQPTQRGIYINNGKKVVVK